MVFGFLAKAQDNSVQPSSIGGLLRRFSTQLSIPTFSNLAILSTFSSANWGTIRPAITVRIIVSSACLSLSSGVSTVTPAVFSGFSYNPMRMVVGDASNRIVL